MNHIDAGKYWNDNAEAWTTIARAGFDIYRDHLNTPAFFEILPDVTGLSGLDIGCGEGYNTRLLAEESANMKAIDISPIFIEKAKDFENASPLGIEYSVASAVNLPFESNHFDFATSFMCMMDVPELKPALNEAYRILKPGGFLQFSITHPCYLTPHRKNLRDHAGKTYAMEIGDYFANTNGKIEEWIFGDAPTDLKNKFTKFKVPVFNRTLSEWFNDILAAKFQIEQVNEPYPGDQIVTTHPSLQDAQVVAYFLHIRCRKNKI